MPDQDLTPEQIVEAHWPYDGPHSTESVVSAAAVVAGLVRYMSNATWPYKQVLNGPGLYRVLNFLNSAVWGMDQLLGQLDSVATGLADDPTMYDDRRDREAWGTAVELAAALAEARQALAGGPRSAVQRAAALACHLGHEDPRSGGDE